MNNSRILPLVLLGLGMCVCQAETAPEAPKESPPQEKPEAKPVTPEVGPLKAVRYDELYQGDFAEFIRRMTTAEKPADFMKQHRAFEEKYPKYWEVSGHLRILLNGLKHRIDQEAALRPSEKEAARDLAEFLVTVERLPSAEPYQDAKVHIASAWVDFDVSQQAKMMEEGFAEAAKKLPLAAKLGDEAPQ